MVDASGSRSDIPTSTSRGQLAGHIHERLAQEKALLTSEFAGSGLIRSCHIDDVLPDRVARAIYDAFPDPETMRFNKSLRERKRVAAQMNLYDPILEEAIYAFQDPSIVADIAEITGLSGLEPDHNLYAGGISLMSQGHFLNPHIDNSHDKDRDRYRVLNLLYYVTPDWQRDFGGNLELWDDGPDGRPREIVSAFNRLVIMATDRSSWHSVNRVRCDGRRCCVSNYYFSRQSMEPEDYFHVTSFRGRPEQPLRDAVLRCDVAARMLVRKLFKKGVRENPHVYRRT